MKITSKQGQKQAFPGLPGMSNLRYAGARTKIFIAAAVSVLLLASCSNSETTPQPNDGRVQFTSGVSGQSRVGGVNGDQWEGTEAIGIYMVETGQTLSASSIKEGADNRKYTTASTGATATFTSATPIYYPVNGPLVDFIAYHPHATSIDQYFWYQMDIKDQTDQSAIDLMTAKADNGGSGYSKTDAEVGLKFTHQLAKVIINVKKGDGIDDLTGLAVTIKGLHHTALFDLKNFTFVGTGSVAGTTITPIHAGNYQYEAILLPTEFYALDAQQVVEFTVGGNTYTWQISENTSNITQFDGGKKYTFDVTITKTRVNATGTINAWTVAGSGSGTAS